MGSYKIIGRDIVHALLHYSLRDTNCLLLINREQYLNGLTKLHRLTCRTNLETKKQQKLEQVLDELRRQAKVVEVQLAQQKTLTKSLYPAIAATQKAITTDRTMLLKLENACNRLGNIVKGPDYK